ncbi:hypothetical protein QQY66_49180 [Streptomyces sp. DG2A-72]|uniref:DUF6884 domain-containing protein n=1 Tax=Streptomyces sp. DG2A-72 TaxID=3051386 RepID=UPI00265BC9FE|nr:DUF6884 domain-containing protein [Streptomyces sp. DG2A-72]MDO0939288.1 hypothetical protein [Streptomyces sp. DG2A-72]
MPTEYVTRTRIAVDHHGRGEAALEFAASAGKGKARASAVWRLAVIYKVSAHHPRRVRHYNPAGLDAPLPTADELRLELSGDPERIARLLSAAPRYLARVEALATKAARIYGRWTRSAAGEQALEYVDASGHRAYAARFRASAFEAAADFFGISALPRYVDPAAPMWDQAARVAWDLVKAEGPVKLAELHDEAEAEEILAAADRTPNPYAEAHDREAAELAAAELRRTTRLFAALDGEELPADEEPVDVAEAAAVEDVDQTPAVTEPELWDGKPGITAGPGVVKPGIHVEYLPAFRPGPRTRHCHSGVIVSVGPKCVRWRPSKWHEDVRTPLGEMRINPVMHVNHAEDVKRNITALNAGKPLPGWPEWCKWSLARHLEHAEEQRSARVVIVACGGRKKTHTKGTRKGQPVAGAPAGELYVGSYHRAMRQAADVLTRDSGRVLILSAKYGLVELSRYLPTYNLKAGAPGTVGGETLRRQAHELGIAGAAVTVLGGRAYVSLAGEVWSGLDAPLDGSRGIGEQLARLADIYDPARRTVEELVEDQAAEELAAVEEPVEVAPAEDAIEDQAAAEGLIEPGLGVPAAVRAAELGAVRSGRRGCGGQRLRGLSRGSLSRGVTCGDSPTPPVLRRTRQHPATPYPYRRTTARQGAGLPVIGRRERMRRPLISVTVAARPVITGGAVR